MSQEITRPASQENTLKVVKMGILVALSHCTGLSDPFPHISGGSVFRV